MNSILVMWFFPFFSLDVKEDKERDPCIFIPHDKSSDVDPKRIQNQKKKVVAPGGVSSILQSATMVVNMAVKGFKKSDKPSVSISEKVSIADPSIWLYLTTKYLLYSYNFML